MSSVRTDYTEKDDIYLVQYLAKYNPQPENRMGNAVYKQLVENAEGKWPWSKRHSWQSWRERYKKKKDEFDIKIRRLVKPRGVEVNSSARPPAKTIQTPGSSRKDTIVVTRRASARKVPSEEPGTQDRARPSTEKMGEGSGVSEYKGGVTGLFADGIAPTKVPTQVFGSEAARTDANSSKRSSKPPSGEKRKAAEEENVEHREAKRRKGKEREVAFQDEQEDAIDEQDIAEHSRSKDFETAVNFVMNKLRPEELVHIQAILERRTESPSMSARTSPTKRTSTPTGKKADKGGAEAVNQPAAHGSTVQPNGSGWGIAIERAGIPPTRDGEYQREYPELSDFEDPDDIPVRAANGNNDARARSNISQPVAESSIELPLFSKFVSEVPESNDEDVAMEDVAETGKGDEIGGSTDEEEIDELDEDGDFEKSSASRVLRSSPPSHRAHNDTTPARPENGSPRAASISTLQKAKSRHMVNGSDDDNYFGSPTASARSPEIESQRSKPPKNYDSITRNDSSAKARATNGAAVTSTPVRPSQNRQPVRIVEGAFRTDVVNGRHPLSAQSKHRLPDISADSDTESEAEELEIVARKRKLLSEDWPTRMKSATKSNPKSHVLDRSNPVSASVNPPNTRVDAEATTGGTDHVPDSRSSVEKSGRRVKTSRHLGTASKPAVDTSVSTHVGSDSIAANDLVRAPALQQKSDVAVDMILDASTIVPRPGSSKLRTEVRETDIGMLAERSEFNHRARRRTFNTVDNGEEEDADMEIAQPQFHALTDRDRIALSEPGLSQNGDVFSAPARRLINGKVKEREHKPSNTLRDARAGRRQTFGGFMRGDGLPVSNIDLRQEVLQRTESIGSGSPNRRLSRANASMGMGLAELFGAQQESPNRRSSIASTIDLSSTFEIPEGDIPETDLQLIHRAGLTLFLKGMSENHGFREEVVWNVYNSRKDLVETDRILREMREEAEKVAEKHLGGGSPDHSSRTRTEAKLDSEPKLGKLASSVSQRETRKRYSAPIPPVQSHIEFTPVRDEALLRRVRDDNELFSPPTTTRAATFSRLAGQGRLDEAFARERRRSSRGGALHPIKLGKADSTPALLFGAKKDKLPEDVDMADPFQDTTHLSQVQQLPQPQPREAAKQNLTSSIPAEGGGGADQEVVWTEAEDEIIFQGVEGDLARLELRKGKGSVKARTAQLIAAGKFF